MLQLRYPLLAVCRTGVTGSNVAPWQEHTERGGQVAHIEETRVCELSLQSAWWVLCILHQNAWKPISCLFVLCDCRLLRLKRRPRRKRQRRVVPMRFVHTRKSGNLYGILLLWQDQALLARRGYSNTVGGLT